MGSRDENIIAQQADVILQDEAVANLLQVALILNIGAALANSGLNDILSAPGGSGNPGAIGTGNATTVGNDIDQYLTQAARTEATDVMDDFANQLAISRGWGSPRPTRASMPSLARESRGRVGPLVPVRRRRSETTR